MMYPYYIKHRDCKLLDDNIKKMKDFINEYKSHEDTVPKRLIDMNIASDYSKLSKMLELCQSENRINI